MILFQQSTQDANVKKRHVVSENPPATSSGVSSLFPQKVIIDLRNGILCEVLMGYEWSLLARIPMEF